jgi:holo-[acyl-carrier protein] synthase
MDIVEIKRIEHSLKTYKGRFCEKNFTQSEREYCSSKRKPAQHYAARFAAKEAVFKALGGPWPAGCGHIDVEVLVEESGKPFIKLSETLEIELKKAGMKRIFLSLTHTKQSAAAVVIIEG